MTTFAEQCQTAFENAKRDAAPFTPSLAQYEVALQPMVDELLRMPRDEARTYIRTSYAHAGGGLMALALRMYLNQETKA